MLQLTIIAIFTPILFYVQSDTLTSQLTYFASKLDRLLSVQGEPREVAFSEMVDLISLNGVFGGGYNSLPTSVGLSIGSLYGNLSLSLFYTLGVFVIFPVAVLLVRVCCTKDLSRIFTYLYILLLCQIMPFLFTSFGLFCWIVCSNAHLRTKRNI